MNAIEETLKRLLQTIEMMGETMVSRFCIQSVPLPLDTTGVALEKLN